jgi:sorting nexin-29
MMCENYRGISLLNTAYKVFSVILFQRLQPIVDTNIGNYQCGFRRGKSTSDHLHSTRQLLEKMREYGVNIYYMFVDFKAAYDSIDRAGFFKAMEEFHVPRKLRGLVELTLKTVRCRVKTCNGITGSFETKKGLRQGDALSCLLFNLALEKVIRETSLDIRGTILHKSLQILAYADDVVI